MEGRRFLRKGRNARFRLWEERDIEGGRIGRIESKENVGREEGRRDDIKDETKKKGRKRGK